MQLIYSLVFLIIVINLIRITFGLSLYVLMLAYAKFNIYFEAINMGLLRKLVCLKDYSVIFATAKSIKAVNLTAPEALIISSRICVRLITLLKPN